MNFSPNVQTPFVDPRHLEKEIASLWGEREIYQSKIRWLDATISDLQQQLKHLNRE